MAAAALGLTLSLSGMAAISYLAEWSAHEQAPEVVVGVAVGLGVGALLAWWQASTTGISRA